MLLLRVVLGGLWEIVGVKEIEELGLWNVGDDVVLSVAILKRNKQYNVIRVQIFFSSWKNRELLEELAIIVWSFMPIAFTWSILSHIYAKSTWNGFNFNCPMAQPQKLFI